MRAPFPIYDLRFTIHGVRFLRRGNRRRGMAERDTSDRDWPEELNPEEPEQRIRVRDRRRINLDGDAPAGGDAPSLKPTYVEELEARTRAAEQKAADVHARFEQVRSELKPETDELRQRLARTAEERAAR